MRSNQVNWCWHLKPISLLCQGNWCKQIPAYTRLSLLCYTLAEESCVTTVSQSSAVVTHFYYLTNNVGVTGSNLAVK